MQCVAIKALERLCALRQGRDQTTNADGLRLAWLCTWLRLSCDHILHVAISISERYGADPNPGSLKDIDAPSRVAELRDIEDPSASSDSYGGFALIRIQTG